MKIQEIKDGLCSLSYGAIPEMEFKALICASQELDQYQRLLEKTEKIKEYFNGRCPALIKEYNGIENIPDWETDCCWEVAKADVLKILQEVE